MSGFGGYGAGGGADEEPLGGASDAAKEAAAASEAQGVVAFTGECGGLLSFVGEVGLGRGELGLALPGILQALPEEPRLADTADFVAPSNDAFLAVLPHQFAQRVHQFGLHVVEPLVVRAEIDRRIGSASILLASFGAVTGREHRRPAAAGRRYARSKNAIRRRDRPGTPVHDSAVWYRSIRPLRNCFVKGHSHAAIRAGLAPSLELVPGALPQPWSAIGGRPHRFDGGNPAVPSSEFISARFSARKRETSSSSSRT